MAGGKSLIRRGSWWYRIARPKDLPDSVGLGGRTSRYPAGGGSPRRFKSDAIHRPLRPYSAQLRPEKSVHIKVQLFEAFRLSTLVTWSLVLSNGSTLVTGRLVLSTSEAGPLVPFFGKNKRRGSDYVVLVGLF